MNKMCTAIDCNRLHMPVICQEEAAVTVGREAVLGGTDTSQQ